MKDAIAAFMAEVISEIVRVPDAKTAILAASMAMMRAELINKFSPAAEIDLAEISEKFFLRLFLQQRYKFL